MQSATTIITSGGIAQAVGKIDSDDASNETRMIVGGSTLRTRRTPVNWAVICLIDQIQREHALAMRQQAEERSREEAEEIQAGLRYQHPLG